MDPLSGHEGHLATTKPHRLSGHRSFIAQLHCSMYPCSAKAPLHCSAAPTLAAPCSVPLAGNVTLGADGLRPSEAREQYAGARIGHTPPSIGERSLLINCSAALLTTQKTDYTNGLKWPAILTTKG